MENKPQITEQELASKQNHDEVIRQLNAHFNGNSKERKVALKNIDKAFDNLVKVNAS